MPQAIKRLIVDASGYMDEVYIDSETLQPVAAADLPNYTVLNEYNTYYDPVASVSTPDVPSETITSGPIPQSQVAQVLERHTNDRAGDAANMGKGPTRDMSNNFGYQHKPGWVGPVTSLAGLVGGPVAGIAGKAINAGWNANNAAAVQKARGTLGLPETIGGMGALKGIMKDDKGQVSKNVTINGKNYAVGFEAMSPTGRTNLTVDEASRRANTLGGLKETAAPAGVEKATGVKGLFSKAKDFFSEVEAKAPTKTTPTDTSAKSNPKGAIGTEAGTRGLRPSPTPNVSTADVNPGTKASVSYSLAGKTRGGVPNKGFVDGIAASAAAAFGEGTHVDVTSGQHNGHGHIGSNRHNDPTTMDFTVTRPDGTTVKANDPDALGFAERAKADGMAIGTGFGTDYMGGTSFHFDQHTATGAQRNQWGNVAKANARTLESAGYLGATREDRAQPHGIPEARPGTSFTTRENALHPELDAVTPAEAQIDRGLVSSVKSKAAPTTAAGIIGNASKVSPAQMATMGKNRSIQDQERIARTIAGELGPKTLAALAAGQPTAKREYASMVATIENRLAKDDIDTVLDGSQYNSNLPSKAKTTNYNYGMYKDTVLGNLGSYYAGTLTKDMPDFDFDSNAYHNKQVEPDWGESNTGKYGLKNAQQIGEHKFGFLSDRSYKTTDLSGQADTPSERSAMSRAAERSAYGIGSGSSSSSRSISGSGSPTGSAKSSYGSGSGSGGSSRSIGGSAGSPSGSSKSSYGVGSGSSSSRSIGGSSKSSSSKSSSSKSSSSSSKSSGPSGGGYGGWGGPR